MPCGNLSDADGFPVQVGPITGDGFNGVANGVSVIQDGPQTSLLFILADHCRFDLATARHDLFQQRGIQFEEAADLGFQSIEQSSIPDDAVFDDLGHACTKLALGQ